MERKDLHDIVNLVTIAIGMAKKSAESLNQCQSSEIEDAKIKLSKSINALERLENLVADIRANKQVESTTTVNSQSTSNSVTINTVEKKENTLKVLIVDDEEDIRDLLIEELTAQDFVTVSATDGRDGFTQYIYHKPDLVISDINMPNLNGIEMTQLIYNKNNKAKFILLGGDVDQQKIESLPHSESIRV